MVTSVQHVYLPHHQICDVFNAEFLGLDSPTDRSILNHPTVEAIAFTSRLIGRILHQGDVYPVVTEHALNSNTVLYNRQRVASKLAFVLGPPGLGAILGERSGSDSWLGDKGSFPCLLYLTT